MEESVCPECKAKIGGANHHLLEDNAWAPDMDEAERPIWDNINADREIAMRLQRELDVSCCNETLLQCKVMMDLSVFDVYVYNTC